ncbi:MAG: carbamoyltransferase [Planctomycetes bacterium]|nr:carbamoyltransferase [Planctomycetota bacterium]
MEKGIGARFPLLERIVRSGTLPLLKAIGHSRKFFTLDSKYAQQTLSDARAKLQAGRSIFVLGFGCGGHNAGVGLVEASLAGGIQVLANHEEERYRGIKHFKRFPDHSLTSTSEELAERGMTLGDLDAVVATWDYIELASQLLGHIAGELPGSLTMVRADASPTFSFRDLCSAFRAPLHFGSRFCGGQPQPFINLRHHDNHAYLAYGASPFAGRPGRSLVTVVDGMGDDTSVTMSVAEGSRLEKFYAGERILDSIGMMYLFLSSSQGGWPPLSSEGRYMGAAAWGDSNRATNPYYAPLKNVFILGEQGQVHLNRRLVNWHRGGSLRPYTKELQRILGTPILPSQMWNPDHVLKVEDIQHAPITRERVDKAAATQLVFEDALLHVLEHGIRQTKASQLVFTGGAALNCLASMNVLNHFDEAWYRKNLGLEETRLHLWVPPIPGDAGAPAGAAYHFACLAGAEIGKRRSILRNPFLCGRSYSQSEIESVIQDAPEVDFQFVANINDPGGIDRLADLMAYIVSQDGVIGIFQGPAETGPRALGHRSILANPTNPRMLQILNERVKFREAIRPLAPMATREAAERLFQLSPGASDDDFDAYNYMVLTVPARQQAYDLVPAVVHRDGTARLQIVREDVDPLIHAYLRAMGRRVGVEVSVNTSLNVGSPIVQRPCQALGALQKSHGLHGLFFVAGDGACLVAWHNIESRSKDSGQQLRAWINNWKLEMGISKEMSPGELTYSRSPAAAA